MQVTTWGLVDSEARSRNAGTARLVEISVDEAQLFAYGGHGEHVACINVERADGKTTRFHLTLYDRGHGRIHASIRAMHKNSETAKSVAGSWLDYEVRRQEILGE